MKVSPWWETTGADEIGHPEERFSSEKQLYLVTNVVCEGEKELSRIFSLENSGRWKEDNEFVLRDVLGAPIGLVQRSLDVRGRGLEIVTYR